MHFLLFKVTIRSYEIVSKFEIDIHMVTFGLFSMHGHTVLKYVIKLCLLCLIMILAANE